MDANDVCFDFVLLTERPGARIARTAEGELSPAERTVRAVLDLVAGIDGTLCFAPDRFLSVALDRSPFWWKARFEALERIGAIRYRQRLALALKIAGVHDAVDVALRSSRIGALSSRHVKVIERVLSGLDNPEESLFETLADYIRRNVDEIPDAVDLFRREVRS